MIMIMTITSDISSAYFFVVYAGAATAQSTVTVAQLQTELKDILRSDYANGKKALKAANLELAKKVRRIVLQIQFESEGRNLANIQVQEQLIKASELPDDKAIDFHALNTYKQLVQPSFKNAIPTIFEDMVEDMFSLKQVLER
jgi:hypothetical protein